jgi:CRISPR/Cas system CSM-associated protein Csm2 small subunit
MEDETRNNDLEKKSNEIVYSRAIKAGKRIYYLDVKKNKSDNLFLAITESKKKVMGSDEDAQVSYEKHKIFLYRQDFEKFIEGLEDVIGFIKRQQPKNLMQNSFMSPTKNR